MTTPTSKEAGSRAVLNIPADISPPAYNNCTCSCHRGSGIIHFVACCAPDRKAEGTTP